MNFGTWAKNVIKMHGGKRGRTHVVSPTKGYPMQIEREVAEYLRKVFTYATEIMTETALQGYSFAADTIGDLNNSEPPLPPDFVEKMTGFSRSLELFSANRFAEESFMVVGERYIPPAVKEELLTGFVEQMQLLCKSTNAQNKANISRIVAEGVAQGKNINQVKSEISKVVPNFSKNKSELIARTETAKLNSSIKAAQYQESGIEYYKWISGHDGHVRDSHLAMNSKICALNNADVYYEETPEGLIKHQRTASMVHLHPGFDFQCRCTMVMWDPEIDGKYDVKTEPQKEPPKIEQPKEPSPDKVELEATKKELEKEKEKVAKAEKKNVETERKLEILKKANERHAKRNRVEIEQRIKERIERNNNFKEAIRVLEINKVKKLEVKKLSKKLTENEIIKRLAGGDQTKGSCSSLALAYAANKAGYDVLDFRGENSQKFFSSPSNISGLVKVGSCKFIENYKTIKKSGYYKKNEVIFLLENNLIEKREYYFVFEGHAAIIRKINGKLEFLELQSSEFKPTSANENFSVYKNEFHELNETKLYKRFGGDYSNILECIDIKNLKDSNQFRLLMEFINTEPEKQKKGYEGNIK